MHERGFRNSRTTVVVKSLSILLVITLVTVGAETVLVSKTVVGAWIIVVVLVKSEVIVRVIVSVEAVLEGQQED